MKRSIGYFAVIFAAAFAVSASAATLYKLIDKKGKVTYSEEKPKNFDGQVIPMEIDPNANTATLPKPAPAAKGVEEGARRGPRDDPRATQRASVEERIRVAREKVENARKALDEAKASPGEEDVTFIGKVGGGARPVPTEQYLQKIAQLEKTLRDAEEELRVAEKES
jgi:hypothetical protein